MAAVLAIAIALVWRERRPPAALTFDSIGATYRLESRPIESRLSVGFAWAPFRSPARAAVLNGPTFAAAAALRSLGEGAATTAEASRATGLAEMLAANPREALSRLTSAAQALQTAAAWSDVSAALQESAMHGGSPAQLAEALAAADRALAIDAELPEALFNRALAMERLGLNDDARAAWQRYLVRDGSGDWAQEARVHLHALAPEPPFSELLDRDYDRVVTDSMTAARLAVHDAFGARVAGVTGVLPRWGDAVLCGDDREAARHLAVARQLGRALARRGGDRMLERAVAAIDGADAGMRIVLARAHVDYAAGLSFVQTSRPVEAEPIFRRAAAEFNNGRSPMMLAALTFAANTAYEQGRRQEAERELERILPALTGDFGGYRGLLLWQLGNCRGSRGDWGAAIATYEDSATLFDVLDERQNAAAVRRVLAFAYEQIGDPVAGWQHRVAALRGIGSQSNLALQKAVASIADAALLRQDWSTAASFLTLEINVAWRLDLDVRRADGLLRRAVVRDRLGDSAAAQRDVRDADAVAARVKDPVYRDYLRVASMRATAMLSATPPAVAEALLTRAIDFQSARSESLELPALFLERARIRRKRALVAAALSDVEAGIAELEKQRQSLPAGESRWGAFHAAEELFDVGVESALSQNDPAAAFRFAERKRARVLLESYGRPAVLDLQRLPRGTVVVEYAVLPSQLVIFTADERGVRAAVAPAGAALEGSVGSFVTAVRQNEARSRGQAMAAYRMLVEPVAPQLLGAETVVFVPDGPLAAVPFAALRSADGRFLLEEHAVVVAPSAAAFEAAAERRQNAAAPRSALLVSAPEAAGESAALPSVESESRQIARLYAHAARIAAAESQMRELIARAPAADVIHFGGHAVGDDRGFVPASLVLRQNGAPSLVGAAEIAKLRLRSSCVVVLAGCNTARGERRAAEGVISVAHGFLSAGAPSVVATLWPIEDEAASRFFPRLHRLLAQGIPAAEALRQVQLEAIRAGDIPESFWAAVQAIGS